MFLDTRVKPEYDEVVGAWFAFFCLTGRTTNLMTG